MRCGAIMPNLIQRNNSQRLQQPTFTNRNRRDYSKDEFRNYDWDEHSHETMKIDKNRYDQPLHIDTKSYEDRKLVRREQYSCTYHDNGHMKRENTIIDDYKDKTRTYVTIEYDTNFHVTRSGKRTERL